MERTEQPESRGGRKSRSPRWRLAATPLWIVAAVAGCSPTGTLRWGRSNGDPSPPRPLSRLDAGRPLATISERDPASTRAETPVVQHFDPVSASRIRRPDNLDSALVRTRAEDPPKPLPPPLPSALADPGNQIERTPPAREAVVSPAIPPPDHGHFPIDLTTALRLAEVENPVIAEARVRVSEALAVQQRARSLLLPSLNAGVNYRGHDGDFQRSSGRIIDVSEQSLYFGGGAGATGAGSIGLANSQLRDIRFPVSFLANDAPNSVPAVNLYSQLAEAIYQPLVAHQEVDRARFTMSATANRVLLEVAELHFELIAATAELEFLRQTARQDGEVVRLTHAYAEAKQGRQADAERALTELRLINRQVLQAEENVAVTSTRLVRRLHLDPTVRLQPANPVLDVITLIAPEQTLPQLLQIALSRRPEVGANEANVARADLRHRQEVHRPLLPTVFLGFSGGAFGGGSNLAPPTIGHFGGRNDFDVGLFWTAENLGIGNLAHMRRRRAELGEATAERSRAFAGIREEVGSALADVLASRPQLGITADQLRSAEAGFEEDLTRIQNVVGRPIEVLNSLRLLNEARLNRVRAVTDYNKAQVRLFVALGSPPPLDRDADVSGPLPPAPMAWPPVSSRSPRGT